MGKKEKDFYVRDHIEQKMLMEDTWCDTCNEADLGIIEPAEFELDGKVYIEGTCIKCGNRVVSEIIVKDASP